MIKSVKFENFKSLSPQTLELGPLNVLIGANASGKSNFADGFKFLRDCLVDGVSAAAARRLGWRNTLARRRPAKDFIRLELELTGVKTPVLPPQPRLPFKEGDLRYSLEIGCRQDEPYVRRETLAATSGERRETVDERFERTTRSFSFQSLALERGPSRGWSAVSRLVPKDRTVIPVSPCWSSFYMLHEVRSWRFYELDTRLARTPSTWEADDVLVGDGANLARVLESVSRTKDRTHARLRKLMGVLVPGFESWRTERQSDGTVVFSAKEKGIPRPLPPPSLSDGTIRLLGVLLAVLHQPKGAALTCIEEPERSIHPQIIKTLVGLLRQGSERRQIIVTTHSAELVRWLQPSEVFLVDKRQSQTVIVRAQDVEHIEKFLEEFRLDELWLHGYLQGGTAL